MLTEITARSLGLSWKALLSSVCEKGDKVMDGETELIELCNVIVCLPSDFELHDEIFDQMYDQSLIDFMERNFFSMEPISNWGYSYGQRLQDYHGINQMKSIADKLRQNPESKSATVCLADPPNDQKHLPCIYCLDFKLRKDELQVTAYFRSQDAGKKYCADIHCLKKIQSQVAEELSCRTGELFLICSSMHIYEQDMEKTQQVLKA